MSGVDARARVAAVAALLLVACAGAPPAVDLSGAWPAEAGDYDDVTEALTRRAVQREKFTVMVDVAATLKSPAWRAAHVRRRADRDRMSSEARAALLKSEREAAAKFHEVELLVATHDTRNNDLGRGERSIWRVVLVGEDGHEVAPVEIVRDRRPRAEIRASFPALGDFHQAYVVRFKGDEPLLAAGRRSLTLRMSSAQAVVHLDWRAR